MKTCRANSSVELYGMYIIDFWLRKKSFQLKLTTDCGLSMTAYGNTVIGPKGVKMVYWFVWSTRDNLTLANDFHMRKIDEQISQREIIKIGLSEDHLTNIFQCQKSIAIDSLHIDGIEIFRQIVSCNENEGEKFPCSNMTDNKTWDYYYQKWNASP